MASDGGAEISGDDEKGGSSARVVDIFAEGITGDWSPSTHLHIMKVKKKGEFLFVFPCGVVWRSVRAT